VSRTGRHGEAVKVGLGKARHVQARQGSPVVASSDMIRRGKVWQGSRGEARHGRAGKSCRGGVWFGGACSVRARQSRRVVVRRGLARQSRLGTVRLGRDSSGVARQSCLGPFRCVWLWYGGAVEASLGSVWLGGLRRDVAVQARQGDVWHGELRSGKARQSRLGPVGFGELRPGKVGYGSHIGINTASAWQRLRCFFYLVGQKGAKT